MPTTIIAVPLGTDPEDDALSREAGRIGRSGARTGARTGTDFSTTQQIQGTVGSGAAATLGGGTSRTQNDVAGQVIRQTIEQTGKPLGLDVGKSDARFEYLTPFLQKWGPRYLAFIQKRASEFADSKKSKDQLKAIQQVTAVRDKLQNESGFTIGKFIGDPLTLFTSAAGAIATGGSSLALDITKRSIQGASTNDAAVAKLNAALDKLYREHEAYAASWFIPRTWEQMHELPAGVVRVSSVDGKTVQQVGKGSLNRSEFMTWFKRRRK